MSLVVISFDGVKDLEFEKMAENPKKYPNIAGFMSESQYIGNVFTTFVSNTYPIHSCISTGRHPKDHGIFSNLLGEEDGYDIWAQEAGLIKHETFYQAAAKKGLKVGSLAWPVSASANIKWNLPEVHLVKNQKRWQEQMRHGSPLFQTLALMRHGKKMQGLKQPQLDDFMSSAAADLLNKKKPDLTMIHLLAYDDHCHAFGVSEEMDEARASLDNSLGRILAAAKDSTVIAFSDHGHLNVSENINLHDICGSALYEQVGGSAFFAAPVENIESQPWFGRFLTEHEMDVSGYKGRAAFGIGAKPGYSFGKKQYKGNHGYPRDYDEYRVFIAVKNSKKGVDNLPFDDIRNVTALIDRELDLGMDLGLVRK